MPEFNIMITQALAWVVANPWSAFTTVVTVASLITAGTPTPAPDTRLGRIYRAVEVLALAIGRAKDTGPRPPADLPTLGIPKLAVPLLALGLLAAASACATFADPQTPAQTVYAIEGDYQIAQRAALAYVSRADADPAIKERVKQLEGSAYEAVAAAHKAVVAGDDPRIAAAIAAAREAVGNLQYYLAREHHR